MSEDPFFSRNNFNAIYEIIRSNINKKLNYDITAEKHWESEIQKIMRNIHSNQLKYRVTPNMRMDERMKILSQATIQASLFHIQSEIQKLRLPIQNRSAYTQQQIPQQRVSTPNVFEQQEQLGMPINNQPNPYATNLHSQSINTKMTQPTTSSYNILSKQREMIEQRPIAPNFKDDIEVNNTDIKKSYEDLLRARDNITIPPPPTNASNQLAEFNMNKEKELIKQMEGDNIDPGYLSFFTNTMITEPVSMQSNNNIMNGENVSYQELTKRINEEPMKDNIVTEYKPMEFNSQVIKPAMIDPVVEAVSIMKPKRTKTLYFNTEFRANYNNTTSVDCVIPISYTLKNIISSRLVDISLKEMHYNFSRLGGTNTFNYIINDIKYTVNIPEGSYSINEFIEMINAHMDVYENLIFQVDKYSNIVSISSVNGGVFTLDFTPLNIDNDRCLGTLLGFREKIYKGSSEYKGTNSYNGDRRHTVYVLLNDYNISDSNSQILLLGNTYIEQNIYGKITEGRMSSKERKYTEPVTITKVGIKLLNEYGETLNINNVDYMFGIEFEMSE